jgi:hypothetical protein
MAAVDILAAFLYKWAQDGTAEALEDTQYKAGWSFIGSTPPSVEQFNKVHQIADEKANWLYQQMLAVFTEAGETPTVGDLNSLRDSLRALSTNRISRFTSAGNFTVPPGITTIYVSGCGGGGGGAAGGGAAGANVGSGGGGGGAGMPIIRQPYVVTPGQVIAITIGGGGSPSTPSPAGGTAGNGLAGTNTVVGALVTLTAGSGGGGGFNAASPAASGFAGAGFPPGGVGDDCSNANATGGGGNGASGPFGTGGLRGRGGNGAGHNAGAAYGYGAGGGGGGGSYTAGAGNGGAATGGMPGIIFIEW